MIRLTHDRQVGRVLRELRRDAGLSARQLAARGYLTLSCVYRRESTGSISSAGLIDHARVLGHVVALIPQRHCAARPTGTGWPA